jgi:hypothetical protein
MYIHIKKEWHMKNLLPGTGTVFVKTNFLDEKYDRRNNLFLFL